MILSAGTSPNPPVLAHRRAGVLLHASSLPSGMLDGDVERWMDFLQACGFSVWQMLPLGPVGPNRSPYSSRSAFAANEKLVPPKERRKRIDPEELDGFRFRESGWLHDFVRFSCIRKTHGGKPWWQWPDDFRYRKHWDVAVFARDNAPLILRAEQAQFRFARRWGEVRNSARARGIQLFGDLPMFVVADSADVWAAPDLFKIGRNGKLAFVAGVPPDAFATKGQSWDNPVYDWHEMRRDRFAWWIRRLELEMKRFDLLRWDHFRGLSATWEIPAARRPQAARGHWEPVPGRELLDALYGNVGLLPVVAENLGIITPDVERLRRARNLPGMHVLQFAFDGNPDNPHLPANHEEQGVAYTGTHDNDTSLGWFQSLPGAVRSQVQDLLRAAGFAEPGSGSGRAAETAVKGTVRGLIRTVLHSRSRLAVIPLQDLLALGSEARMNIPGRSRGQWRWRFSWDDLTPELARSCREMVMESGRICPKGTETKVFY